jgi:hypothetical protein
VIVAHIFGLPVEETFVQVAPLGATAVTTLAIVGRTRLGRLGRAIIRRTQVGQPAREETS